MAGNDQLAEVVLPQSIGLYGVLVTHKGMTRNKGQTEISFKREIKKGKSIRNHLAKASVDRCILREENMKNKLCMFSLCLGNFHKTQKIGLLHNAS